MEIKNLKVGYPSQDSSLIKGLNAAVPAGRCIMLVGRNGTGKSTLLRTLAGLHEPQDGNILLGGDPLVGMGVATRARRVSMVFSTGQLTRNITVRELAELGRIPYTGRLGRLSAEDREWVDAAIDACYLGKLQNRKLHSVSDGELQKAMIARALAQDTGVMLLDEPTAYLDLGNKIAITELLGNLCETQDKTVIFSSHDLPVSLRLAHEVWFLKGRDIAEGVVWQGTPQELAGEGLVSLLAPGFELSLSKENFELEWKKKQ